MDGSMRLVRRLAKNDTLRSKKTVEEEQQEGILGKERGKKERKEGGRKWKRNEMRWRQQRSVHRYSHGHTCVAIDSPGCWFARARSNGKKDRQTGRKRERESIQTQTSKRSEAAVAGFCWCRRVHERRWTPDRKSEKLEEGGGQLSLDKEKT